MQPVLLQHHEENSDELPVVEVLQEAFEDLVLNLI
jgi:hypothetical protein